MTHDELASNLADWLGGKGDRLIWTNLQLGPSGSVRPDVYTLAKSYTRPAPRAYEVKVSLADFRRDAQAGKWMAYREFAEHVYFAAPSGLIPRDELPAGCGLIVRGAEGWRATKGATARSIEIPVDALLKLLFDGEAKRHDRGAHARRFDEWRAQQKLAQRFGEETARLLRDLGAARAELTLLEERIEQTRERARRDAEARLAHDRDVVKNELRRVAQALGLPLDSSADDIRRALWAVRDRITTDAEVQRLTCALESVQRALANVDFPLARPA